MGKQVGRKYNIFPFEYEKREFEDCSIFVYLLVLVVLRIRNIYIRDRTVTDYSCQCVRSGRIVTMSRYSDREYVGSMLVTGVYQ